ncbi:hypothetical protein JVU11DRAFT_8233 [Chiua virens]|nr:hypothetical protein JVU11DRAFT_8233 [Chiua virens]
MSGVLEKDRPRSPRPHLQVKIHSGESVTAAAVGPPDSLSNTLLDKETGGDGKDSVETSAAEKMPFWRTLKLPPSLQWVPANCTWSKWKPVLRSALAAWIGLLLFLIPTTLNTMGQASFLIIIASFLSPPSDPFIAVLQRELGILIFAASGWAWSCLGIKLAYIARSNKNPMPLSQVSSLASTLKQCVIIALFMFVGCSVFLYIKSRVGPGPLTIAIIFGCLCIDISLTTAVLFPYPNYLVGKSILLPLTFHSAVALILSFGLFPTSESAVFTARLQDVLLSLAYATNEHRQHLQKDITAPGFSTAAIFATVAKAEGALAMLASAARLQRLDIIYSRLAPTDYMQLHTLTRQLIVRAGGMNVYYTLIDPTRERFPFTPLPKKGDGFAQIGLRNTKTLHRELSSSLDDFVSKKRFAILDPYRAMLAAADDSSAERDIIPHRHLFNCYVYQYHLMRFATSVQDTLGEIIRLETERETARMWFPRIHRSKLLHRTTWEPSESMERDDDENPDVIPGLDPASQTDLGDAVRRDPDVLPPRNALEKTVNWMYHTAKEIGSGNVLFALKAGILTILLALPSFLKSSGGYAYKNKFVWAVFMGQFTLSRFRGDTTFGLVTRIVSTFIGGIIGTIMWYISSGSGEGNPYGLAALCFVCFPFFFFIRLYWPVSPMTNLIIWVTAALVFGYSYQDTHLASPTSPGYGFDVAWKRFLLVTIGVTAAGIFSFLPPSTTIRLYQRKTMATTTCEMGAIYCSVISFANTKKEGETAVIVQHILAIVSKLKRSLVLKQNVVYEFSLRGKWPAERYQRILELQVQILNLLSQLTSVLEQMEPAWTLAFLKRTRLSDADFQGDVLAVMSLISSSLRTGNPLPQVTPSPLLNRFMERHHGLNVVHEESEEDFGLPKVLTEETLESLQYLTFSVGVATAFAIVMRLDKLMVAVKELVGEHYHIHGVGLPLYHRRGRGVEMRSPVSTMMPGSSAQ